MGPRSGPILLNSFDFFFNFVIIPLTRFVNSLRGFDSKRGIIMFADSEEVQTDLNINRKL